MIRSRAGAVLFAAACWLTAASAHADIPPPDSCGASAKAGEACSNAGENADQKGRCKQQTCTKGPPGDQMSYECLRCEIDADGQSSKGDDGGCSVSGVGTERGIAGLLLIAGLGLLVRERRR